MATYRDFLTAGLALPSVEERVTWGTSHTLRIGDRMFALGAPDSVHVTVKASREEQAELVADDPETFSVAPYVGRFGWVRIALERIDPGELRELLVEAWRATAPKKLLRAFDEEHGEG